MPVKRGVQLRRCSLCGRAGHNRARCESNKEKIKVQKTAKTKVENHLSADDSLVISKEKNSKFIWVERVGLHKQSPHIVNLKKDKPSISLGIEVYQEKKKKEAEWVKADFAKMIREANESSKIKTFVTTVDRQNSKSKTKNYKIKLPKISFPKFEVNHYLLFLKNKLVNKLQIANCKLQVIGEFFTFRRLAYSVITLLFLVSLPFPAVGYYHQVKDDSAKVVAESTNAFLALQSSTVAAFQSNILQAESDLNIALNSFNNANEILEKEHRALLYVTSLLPIVGTQIMSREHLLKAGHHLALGNTYLVKGIKESEGKDLVLIDKLHILANHLRSAVPQYQAALEELSAVDAKVVPVEYQNSFKEFKLLFAALIDDLNNLVYLTNIIDTVFGGEQLQRYLLVFQNNTELRPTGGFMGSFAVLDMQKGKMLNFELPGGGTYDLQGQLDIFVKPPLPLQLVNKRWEFQDSNWFPDFPTAAKKMAWFYESGRNTSVDGVIAINATVLTRLFKILGPVTLNELDLNESDVLEKLQYQVELDYDKDKNQPKEVLADLAEQFFIQLTNLNAINAVQFLTELHEALEQKEIQFHFNDNKTQKLVQEFGWTGEIIQTPFNQDYLAVIGANLLGAKSDAKIKAVIEHQAEIQSDGSIVDTVIIHKKNLATLDEQFYGVNNIHYLRVYVPQGAELIEAGGFNYPSEDLFKVPENWYKDDIDLLNYEKDIGIHDKSGVKITEEFGKTVFGNWMIVPPGESVSVYFVYRLPFKAELELEKNNNSLAGWTGKLMGTNNLASRYSLLVQKQSGTNYDFSSRIIYPSGWAPVWQEGRHLNLAKNGAEFSTILQTDQIVGLVMEKK